MTYAIRHNVDTSHSMSSGTQWTIELITYLAPAEYISQLQKEASTHLRGRMNMTV